MHKSVDAHARLHADIGGVYAPIAQPRLKRLPDHAHPVDALPDPFLMGPPTRAQVEAWAVYECLYEMREYGRDNEGHYSCTQTTGD